MVTLQEARRQISQAKQSLASQKSKVAERRKQAIQQEKKLTQQEKKLPSFSQQRLRGGSLKGLQGRKVRRSISSMKEQIKERKGELKEFKKGLTKYEKEKLKPFEYEIKQQESVLSEAEQQKKSYEKAKAVVDKGGLGYSELSSTERKIYDRLAYNEAEGYASSYLASKGIKPIISGGFVTGYEDIKKGFSFAPEYLGTQLSKKNIKIKEPNLNIESFNLKGLSRQDKLDFKGFNTNKIKNLLTSSVDLISKPFSFTGQVVKTPPKPTPNKTKINITKSNKTSYDNILKSNIKQEQDLFFGNNKKSKLNILGF